MNKVKNIKVVFDIICQSKDNPLKKIYFFAAFFVHYAFKSLKVNVVFFPKMIIKVDGCIFQTRENSIDFWMFWRDYEKDIFKEINQIKKAGTFIDVGANVGRYTVTMAKKGWKVYAFEPLKNNFEKLKEHVRMNKIEKNVILRNIGLGDKKEKRRIYFQPHKHGEASIIKDKKRSVSEDILLDKLDNIFLNEKHKEPLIVKIDVEGSEYEVLLGVKKLIKKYKPIIILEMWEKEKDSKFLENFEYRQKGDFWHYEK